MKMSRTAEREKNLYKNVINWTKTTKVSKTAQNVNKYAIFVYLVIHSFNFLDSYVLQREKKRTSNI